MKETHSITVMEKLLPWEDFSYKKDLLRKYADHIGRCDTEFFSLVNKIFIDEGEKGEIVDEMILKTKQLEVWNTNLLLDVNYKISQVVNRFDDQVDEMKQQRITITYENIFAI
ncbi:hypothetical protein CWR48_19125 [Oceanobacillus arenosus]|uniref:Uncharacterized protein n=1 Tax=Oceanobacillus arenosus TaxID=1229153 RepID=A0A3D8PKT3_9BACI|nr:hypothetical protein [Oceanobacillus arenosus]RDW15838.1 hypothetical protein CWR48_19125 [Oceanobacillus arenosus]